MNLAKLVIDLNNMEWVGEKGSPESIFVTFKLMMGESVMIAVFLVVMPMTAVTKYVNGVHSNTVHIDKSSGFHILELHGMTAGITSSIFIGGMMLLFAAYFAYKIGLGKILGCYCRCPADREGQGVSASGVMRPQMQMTQSLPMIAHDCPAATTTATGNPARHGTI